MLQTYRGCPFTCSFCEWGTLASPKRMRGYGCTVRVYHCVVLPSALMVRAPASFAMDFDPYPLKMRSCLGWSEAAFAAEHAFLSRRASEDGGYCGDYFWVFPATG